LENSYGMAWAVVLLPVLGFLLLAFFGSKLEKAVGRKTLAILAVAPIIVSFFISAWLTTQLSSLDPIARSIVVSGIPWIDVYGLKIPFELLVDPLSMTMALIITGVGSLIFVYSTGYMGTEREYSRFFTYMNLFAASMLLLVLGGNLPLLFIGWEGVGLCSYLLIGFWYKDLPNAKAANKAFIVNRIGDWGLSLGIFLIVVLAASGPSTMTQGRYLSFDRLALSLPLILQQHPALCTAAALLLFVGACGKSAQFPLYLWLPDAMAGPTPVSALIHAATMVTSGVVLLNRMHYVFELSTVASAVICAIGAFTAFFAALIAFGQTDIKRVLAYSTVSQLGFMFIGVGSGAYWAGMFHVTTHAFFKALLFLGAGSVINAMAHNQDMRNYGNLRKYLPITFWTMLIGGLAISAVAIPHVFGFAGFYSKDALIDAAFNATNTAIGGVEISVFAGWLGLFTAMLTAAYMTRLTWLTFMGKDERWRLIPASAHADHHEAHAEPLAATEADGESDPDGFFYATAISHEEQHEHELDSDHTPKEAPITMWVPLVVLAFLSVVGGWALANGGTFENWLKPSSAPTFIEPLEIPSKVPVEWISFAAAIVGILGAYLVYRKGLPKSQGWNDADWGPFRLSARDQFGFDAAMTSATVDGGGQLATALWKDVDDGLIDRFVNGLGAAAASIGSALSVVQRGLIRSYALLMLLGGILIVGYMTFALGLVHHVGGGH